MPSGMINNTQLPPIQGGNAGPSGYVMEGGMMRQVDEMDEDMAGMDEYGVSSVYVLYISLKISLFGGKWDSICITAKFHVLI